MNCGIAARFTTPMVRCFTDTSGVLALGNLPERLSVTSIVRPIISATTFLLRRFVVSILVRMLVDPSSRFTSLTRLKNTSPLRSQWRFWLPLAPLDTTNGHLGFILHTVTSFHRPRLNHYYGFICHLAPTSTLSFLLYRCFHHPDEFGVRLPRLLHRSLPEIPPSNTTQN